MTVSDVLLSQDDLDAPAADSSGVLQLIKQARMNDAPAMMKLIADGVDVSGQDRAGQTALHIVRQPGHSFHPQ